MEWLKKNTEIIDENDLISIFKNKKKLSRPSSMVTFDDGYVDNYNLAYPILKHLNIPAIFFIPTGNIESRSLGWWDIIAFLIKKTEKSSIVFDDIEVSFIDVDNAIKYFFEKMKLEPYENTKKLLFKLSEACEVPFPSFDLQDNELMNWKHIREISDNGLTIGSHTHSHRVLATIPFDEQKKELVRSKSILERETSNNVRSISYPVGFYSHFTKETQALASECGYDLGFSFNTGVNYDQDIYPFDVKRVESEPEIEIFATMAMFPGIFINKTRSPYT
jgi:peptidoglycan/xylan/chitin deacetylase (PgdA/CDA1 family)